MLYLGRDIRVCSTFNDSNDMVLITTAFKLAELLLKRPFSLIQFLCDATAVSSRRQRIHLDLSATCQATTHNFSFTVTFSGSEKKLLIVIVGLQIELHDWSIYMFSSVPPFKCVSPNTWNLEDVCTSVTWTSCQIERIQSFSSSHWIK
jgi:hypothetical protein